MISSITISNFRGIEYLSVENFGKINVFVGKNNSGKTTLLEALFLIIGISNPFLSIGINSNRGYAEPDETGVSLIYRDFQFENKITITAHLLPKETRTLTISPSYGQLINDTTGKKIDELSANSTSLRPTVVGVNYEFTIQSKNSSKKKYTSTFVHKNGLIQQNIDNNYTEQLLGRTISTTHILSSLDKNIEPLIIEKNTNGLIEALKKVDPKIQNIQLGADGKILCDIGLQKLVPINIMGDGIVKIIAVVAALSSVKNGVLLIDELENGLHYSTLKVMWEAIKEAAIQYNVQLFVTSHSYECLKALRESTNEFTIYRIEKSDNTIRTVSFDSEELEGMIENGWEVR